MDSSKINKQFISLNSKNSKKDFDKINKKHVTTNKDLREKAEKMESVFMSQVVKAMRKTIPKTKNNPAGNLSSFMFSRVMGKAMAKSDIGISKMIYNSLQKGNGKKINMDKIESKSPLNTFEMLKNLQG